MGHTKSRSKIASETLGLSLGQVRGCLLSATCRGCRRQALVSLDALSAQFGGHHRLWQVAARLRCAYCSNGPADVRLRTQAGEMIGLIGSGAA